MLPRATYHYKRRVSAGTFGTTGAVCINLAQNVFQAWGTNPHYSLYPSPALLWALKFRKLA